MKAAVTFPLATAVDSLASARARSRSAFLLGRQCLPRVERVERKTAVLHAGPMTQDADVLSLNLSWGCAHQCAFCSVRAQPSYPGDEVVYLYADTAKGLKAELAARRRPPRAVYICPATDPFPPLAEVQQETGRVVAVLAERCVQALLLTRGYIRPSAQGGPA